MEIYLPAESGTNVLSYVTYERSELFSQSSEFKGLSHQTSFAQKWCGEDMAMLALKNVKLSF
jgi:hypothetical protein